MRTERVPLQWLHLKHVLWYETPSAVRRSMKWTVLSQVLHLSCVPVKDMAIELCACTCQDSGLEPTLAAVRAGGSRPAGNNRTDEQTGADGGEDARSLARDSGKEGRSRG